MKPSITAPNCWAPRTQPGLLPLNRRANQQIAIYLISDDCRRECRRPASTKAKVFENSLTLFAHIGHMRKRRRGAQKIA